MQSIVDREIDEMVKNKCIEPTSSPCNSWIVLAKKKEGTIL